METRTPPITQETEGTPRRKARTRRRRWPWVVLVLFLLIAAGAYKYTRPKPDDTKTASATRQDIHQTVTATGSVVLQTAAEVKIGAEVSGKVKRLYVDVGDAVHPGQLIAELENPESDAMLEQARASVDAAAARVREAEAGLSQQRPETAAAIARARATLRAADARYQQTVLSAQSQPGATRADIDRATAELRVAQDAQVQARESADLQVQTAQAALDASQAQADLSAANVKRAQQLVAKGYISRTEADTSVTTNRVNEADVAAKTKALALAQASARHDLASAQHRVASAQASLDASRAGASQVGIRNAEAEAARQDLENARQGLAAAVAGQGDVAVRVAQAEEAQAAMRQSSAEYQRQLRNISKMRIYSPMEGIVTSVETKVGETVTAGFQTPTLMTIANLHRTQVDVPVDETDIGKLSVGQKAKVTVDAFPNHPLPGRVIKMAADATVANNVVTYNCTVAIDRADVSLKPKMTATVEIDTGIVKHALVVPLDAIKTSRDKDVVYLAPEKAKGKERRPAPFKEVDVRTGASDDKVIQVISGLKDGQQVVVSSTRLEQQRLKQGASS